MSEDLTNVPLDQLRAEVQRRENEAKQQRNENLALRQALIVDHVDTLLQLVPEHGRTSCSDANPGNAASDRNPRCNRCQLLRIKQDNYNDSFVLNISVEYQRPEE
jgi:hypothetical protein